MQDKNKLLRLFYIVFAIFVCFMLFLAIKDAMSSKNEDQLQFERTPIVSWMVTVDGDESERYDLPVRIPVHHGKSVMMETDLPGDITDGMWLNFYTECDCEAYIDGVLRKSYDRSEVELWGGAVKPVSLFIKLGADDAGRRIKIIFNDKEGGNGVLNEIFIGDPLGLISGDLLHYAILLLFAVFLTFMCLVIILFDIVAAVLNKRRLGIAHLALGALFATLWIFFNSKIFQYITATKYINGPMGYICIMLVPIPVVFYVNMMQKSRYITFHIIVSSVAMMTLVISTVLHFSDTVSYLGFRMIIHLMFVLLIIVELVIILADIKNGHLKEYYLIAIGLGITLFFGMLELIQNFLGVFGNEGLFLEIGISGVLITGFLQQLAKNHVDEVKRKEAIAANESKSAFVASMSHELRTPINSIIGMNEMILRENRDPKIREYANQVDRSGKLLLGMINDVLDFSKIEAGKMTIVESVYQTVPAISDMIHVLEERTVSHSLRSEYVISPDIPEKLIGDEIHIKQILINLISNAVKYSKEGTVTLKITCAPGGDNDTVMMNFIVSDQGIGIRKEELNTLFDRFIRADEKKNKSIEGSGLGLSIVKSLVDQMNGSISVESEYGQGSTFTVIIPQKISEAAPIGDIKEAIRKNSEESPEYVERFHAPDARILIVDDNLVNLKVATELLKSTKMQIDTATGGKECIYKCRNKRYDLILMDHRMPDPDGIETLHRLREDFAGVNYDTKVIVLTANVYAGIKEMYLSEGFVDYLSKPIDSELLERCIIKHLDPSLVIPYEESREAEAPERDSCTVSFGNTCVTGEDSFSITEQKADSILRRALGRKDDQTENEENRTDDKEMNTKKGLIENLRELNEMDIDKTLERYGSKPEFLKILFSAIVTDGRKKSEEMLEHLAIKDYKSFGIEAHATKSSMATIYADAISERAKQHEFACREERYDFVEADGEAFVKAYLDFLDKVDNAMKNSVD